VYGNPTGLLGNSKPGEQSRSEENNPE